MKKDKHQTLTLEKFTVAKLNNLSSIYGGSGTGDGDDGQGDTITDATKLPPTQRPTIG